ncbi:ras-like GTP-binding protein Rho1 [Zophobas morio]|uniref:ras-like GTP-binding protein Rho1 n=1 Tax=Zophobas morio TaxID=2755281 RepID=UPI003082D8AF
MSDKKGRKKTHLKVVVVGDGACGKTCLLTVYVQKKFPEEYVPTVFENHVSEVSCDGKDYELALWDTAGQEEYDRLRPLSYCETDCIVVCFAVDMRDSLENIEPKWIAEVKHYCPNEPIVLCALKVDLRDSEKGCISREEGQQLADKLNVAYVECSAKNNENVNLVFETAIRACSKPVQKSFCTLL